MSEARRRVSALPPEQRRQALIAVTIPLLKELGVQVSTRQIADAAGVAEGTLFKVFPDKASLLRAAVLSVLDPGPAIAALRAIDRALPLRTRLVAVVSVLAQRVDNRGPLLALVRGPLFAGEDDALAQVGLGRHRITFEVAEVIEPDRDRLRRGPGITARLLMSIVFASRGDLGGIEEPLDPDEVVSLLLDGLLMRESNADQTAA